MLGIENLFKKKSQPIDINTELVNIEKCRDYHGLPKYYNVGISGEMHEYNMEYKRLVCSSCGNTIFCVSAEHVAFICAECNEIKKVHI